MAPTENKILQLFEKGEHQTIVELVRPPGKSSLEKMCLIGALAFLGRLTEADDLFKISEAKLQGPHLARARFLLAIAFVRIQKKQKAQAYLKANLEAADLKYRPDTWQGIGIFYYYQAQFKKAAHFARRAQTLALKEDDSYLLALATDLYGHSLVQEGQRAKGIRQLGLAHEIGQRQGKADRFLPQKLIYEAEAGLRPNEVVAELESLLEIGSQQNSYTRNNVILELARQYTLRGQWKRARDFLDSEAHSIYSFEHPGQEITLQLRLAEVSYRQGEALSAKHFLQSAKRLIDPKDNGLNHLKVLGLDLKITEDLLQHEAEALKLKELMNERHRKTPNEVTRRVLQRRSGVNQPPKHLGEDPLGDLMDQIFFDSDKALERVLEIGWLGLAPQCLKLKPGSEHFQLLRGGRWVAIFKEGVYQSETSLPTQSQKILIKLSEGLQSKESLVKAIWGYQYDPLRHDSLVYSALSSLRKSLGFISRIIDTQDLGWQLSPGLTLKAHTRSLPEPRELNDQSVPEMGVTLNWRQMKALEALPEPQGWTMAQYRLHFTVSTMTSWRDLDGLVKLGYLYKRGRGRSTSYHLIKE